MGFGAGLTGFRVLVFVGSGFEVEMGGGFGEVCIWTEGLKPHSKKGQQSHSNERILRLVLYGSCIVQVRFNGHDPRHRIMSQAGPGVAGNSTRSANLPCYLEPQGKIGLGAQGFELRV